MFARRLALTALATLVSAGPADLPGSGWDPADRMQTHAGTLSTAAQHTALALAEFRLTQTVARDAQWFVVDIERGQYWDVADPLRAELEERDRAAAGQPLALTAETGHELSEDEIVWFWDDAVAQRDAWWRECGGGGGSGRGGGSGNDTVPSATYTGPSTATPSTDTGTGTGASDTEPSYAFTISAAATSPSAGLATLPPLSLPPGSPPQPSAGAVCVHVGCLLDFNCRPPCAYCRTTSFGGPRGMVGACV